ncbi:MAG: sensor domain-containing diguanylate cyclase [Candidatus Lustribacter sp.]
MRASLDTAEVTDGTAPAGEFGRVLRFGLGLLLFALVITPVAGIDLGVSYPVFAMLATATITTAAITALLLLVQARAVRSVPTAVLGTGFAFAAAAMVPYTLLFPGVVPGLGTALGASPTAYQYLWMLSRTGLLVALLAYQWLRMAERSEPLAGGRGRSAIGGLVAAYVVLTPAAIWLPRLPPTIEDGKWSPIFLQLMVPAIVLLAAASVVETIRSRKRANVLDAWAAMIPFGIIVETYLALVGISRFTSGWYASRVVVLFATSAVLTVLLVQAARLYADLIERAVVLEGEAHTDTLTGLPNRRRFDEEFTRAFGSAIRRSSPIGIAVIDIDFFKNYNDALGHQAGDEALRRIARAIAESVERSGDFAARYGGEEFVVILEDTTLAGAAGVAERIRNAVLEAGIAAPGGGLLSVSVGVAARLPGSTGEALLRQADAALYDAKRNGRNRVSSWRSQEIAPIGSAFDDPVLD